MPETSRRLDNAEEDLRELRRELHQVRWLMLFVSLCWLAYCIQGCAHILGELD